MEFRQPSASDKMPSDPSFERHRPSKEGLAGTSAEIISITEVRNFPDKLSDRRFTAKMEGHAVRLSYPNSLARFTADISCNSLMNLGCQEQLILSLAE
ncbi:hypothetical protein CDAR_600931 [Caerostris darwini]|uniref:Uncharacterized protein n=1 Tax=Caerostris darwini TaxID=1538125 RepID=A0AAV4TSD9_9ARAC|nr:hypothetical protein CDAR_600931 [Caerostris darwini]